MSAKNLGGRVMVFKLISILIGLLFSILVAETVARFWLFGAEALNFKKVNSFTPIRYTDYVRPSQNQGVWFELKPGTAAYFKKEKIKINSLGLRDREYVLAKPPNTFRIAVVGDSYTFGDGVKIEDAYHSVLEQKLNETYGQPRFEVINFGLGGYNLRNYAAIIQHKVPDYSPDMVLIGFCANNDDDLPTPEQITKPYTKQQPQKHLWFVKNLQIVRTIGGIVANIKQSDKIKRNDKMSDQTKDYLTCSFKEFKRIEEASSVPIVFLYLDMQDTPDEKARFVEGLCNENGFHFIDSSTSVDTIGDISRYWIHPTDHHPNARMNGLYANLLMEHLFDRYPAAKIFERK
jgi:hypothetical protein